MAPIVSGVAVDHMRQFIRNTTIDLNHTLITEIMLSMNCMRPKNFPSLETKET